MATIRDIAKESGVSPASVSRILNNDSTLQVTDETRKRVVAAAKKLGYVKKGGVKSKAAFKLGILQWFSAEQELDDDYYLRVRRGIENFGIKNAISVVRAYRTDMDYLETLKDCDGLVCVGKFSKQDADALIAFNSNIVFLDMLTEYSDITTITIDLYNAAMEALNYLKSLGHSSICYLGGVEYASGQDIIEDDRRKAYVKFMKSNKFSYNGLLKEDEFNSESGYSMMKEVLKGKVIPTAVFAASDAIAIGAMRAIREHKLKIPRDISIISINDDEVSAFTDPPLTTMRAPAYDMGEHGANIVYMAGNLEKKTPMKIKIPCTMVVRRSCAERKK
ncbi:MAG: LacI family DNA-binding transcriptional regulator [Clostridiales bacterium]|nr:LacI family DNA-binding transcriptional regulator [Clostridiales bacterium]